MEIKEILETIHKTKDCIVFPPMDMLPKIEQGLIMPEELKEFYSLCGGVSLFVTEQYSISIVGPDNFVLANPVIVGERCEEDISANWYIIGREGLSEFITIDLHPDRNGKCYDSFFDRHGVVGECAVVAKSFSELLERLLENKGQRRYWLNEGFTYLGDAYDT